MKKSTLNTSHMDTILKIDALTPNVDLFWDILDHMNSIENSDEIVSKKEYYVSIFEQLLLSSGSVSQDDAQAFLQLIQSSVFLKSYIQIVNNMSYVTSTGDFSVKDAEIVSRKNNPLFKISELETQLMSLIIKSRLQHALNNGQDSVSFDGGKFVRVGNMDYEIIETKNNLSILFNNEIGYGLFRKVVSGLEPNNPYLEKVVEGYDDIHFSQSEKLGLVELLSKNKIELFDIGLNRVLFTCDKILSSISVGSDYIFHCLDNGENVLRTLSGRELYRYPKVQLDFKLEAILYNGKYLVLKNKNLIYLFNISSEKMVLQMFDFQTQSQSPECIHFITDKGSGVYDLARGEILVFGKEHCSQVLDIGGKKVIRYTNNDKEALYCIDYDSTVLYFKTFIEFKNTPKGPLVFFCDQTGEGMYDLGNDRTLLEGKETIDLIEGSYEKTGNTEIVYKEKGFFKRKKVLQY